MASYSKRDVSLFFLGLLVAGVLTAWLTVVGMQSYLESTHANDPLARAGGPKSGKAIGSDR